MLRAPKSRFLTVVFYALMLLVVVIAVLLDQLSYDRAASEYKENVKEVATLNQAQFQSLITANVQLVRGLVPAIAANPDLTQAEFENIAKTLLQNSEELRHIGAAPDLVLSMVYPLEGNEAALGLDYMNHPQQRANALAAKEKRDIIVAAPIELVQGGIGVIARLPVYIEHPTEPFWGLVSAVFSAEKLYQNSELSKLSQDYDFWLSVPNTRGKRETLYGSPIPSSAQPLILNVWVLDETWQLELAPKSGWEPPLHTYFYYRVTIVASAVIILIVLWILRRLLVGQMLNKKRLQSLFEHSPTLIALCDPDDDKVILSNRTLAENNHQKLNNVALQSLFRENSLPELDGSNFFDIRTSLLASPEEEIPVNVHGVYFEDQNHKQLMWLLIEDLREQLEKDKSIREQAQRLELIINTLGVGTWDWNVQSESIRFNERWANIIGYSEDELSCADIHTCLDMTHPDDVIMATKRLNEYWRGETDHYRCELRMRHKRGYWVWILATGVVVEWFSDGKPKNMIGTHLDISELKNAEQELLSAKQELERFFENGANYMVIMDSLGTIERINSPLLRALGLTASEVRHKAIGRFVHSDDTGLMRQHIAELSAEDFQAQFECRLVKFNDSTLHCDINLAYDESREKIYLVATDVSDKHIIAEQLNEQQQLLELMSTQARIGAWEFNLKSQKASWSQVNREIHELDDNTQINASNLFSYFTPTSSKQIDVLIKNTIATGEPFDVELQIITAKGQTKWVRARTQARMEHGKCTHLYGSIQDIDAEKRGQLAQFQLSQRNSALASLTVNEAVLNGNLKQAKHTITKLISRTLKAQRVSLWFFNERQSKLSLASLYDLERDVFIESGELRRDKYANYFDAIFKHAIINVSDARNNPITAEFVDDYLIPNNIHAMLDCAITGKSGVVGVICAEHIGETREWTQNDENFLISAANIVGGVYANYERQKTEKALRRAKEAAEHAAKVKSEFLAMMSHELRTPMNGVIGMLDLISDSELDQAQNHHVELAQSSAKNLLGIINDVLDFSRIEAGKIELEQVRFDIHQELAQVIESQMLKAHSGSNKVYLHSHTIDVQFVYGDPLRIRQILTNLLSNALKFTEQGEIHIHATLRGQRFEVAVKDTGIGISEQAQKHLFDAFTQADNSTTRRFGGTGLGLSIVKQLCVHMRGDIEVSSKEGEGSEFKFHVHLRPDQGTKITPILAQQSVAILLQDSKQSDLASEQCQRLGAKTTICNDADSLQHELNSNRPDIAIIEAKLLLKDAKQLPILYDALKNKQLRVLVVSQVGELKEVHATLKQPNFLLAHFPLTYDDVLNIHNYKAPKPKQQNLDDTSYRCLLVEDNKVNQVVTTSILTKLGYQFDIADDGQVALDTLNNSSENKYQLILMDCQMPVMDGYQATKAIRSGLAGRDYEDIPIIALTANAVAGDKEKCLQAGMSDYLSKPINADELKNKLVMWQLKKHTAQVNTH